MKSGVRIAFFFILHLLPFRYNVDLMFLSMDFYSVFSLYAIFTSLLCGCFFAVSLCVLVFNQIYYIMNIILSILNAVL